MDLAQQSGQNPKAHEVCPGGRAAKSGGTSRVTPYVFRDEPQEISTRLNIGMKGAGKTSLLDFQLQAIRSSRQRAGGRLILVDPTTDDFHFKNFGRIVETPT